MGSKGKRKRRQSMGTLGRAEGWGRGASELTDVDVDVGLVKQIPQTAEFGADVLLSARRIFRRCRRAEPRVGGRNRARPLAGGRNERSSPPCSFLL